jgi:hypothetical protein
VKNNVLILVFLLIFVFLLSKNKGITSCSERKSDTTTIHDTTWKVNIKKYPVYTPGPVVTLPGDTQWLLQPIDTMSLLRDYYSRRVYFDTIWIDSFGFVYWGDTVNKNRIVSRQKGTNYKIPTITKTITINNYYNQRRQLNITGLVDVLNPTLYGGLLYEDRKDRIYHLNIGVGLRGSSLIGGVSFPILKESSILKK